MATINLIDSTGAVVPCYPFASGAEAAVQTGAAAVTLKAAVALKRHFITGWRVTNITAGEYPIAVLQDNTGTPIKHAHCTPEQPIATSKGTIQNRFDPPLEIASGKSVDYSLQAATGDCHSNVEGYVEA